MTSSSFVFGYMKETRSSASSMLFVVSWMETRFSCREVDKDRG